MGVRSEKLGMTVLVVDDELVDRKQMERLLRAGPLSIGKILHADRMQACLDLLGDQKVDVVLLDLNLPDSNGLDTVVRVHEADPTVPVVVVTGQGGGQVGLEAVAQGAQDYLVKGEFDAQTLARVIHYACERKRQEEAIRRERDFAETLIETAQVIVLVLDAEGRIVRFNRYMEEISGYTVEEVRGHDWVEALVPPGDRCGIAEVFSRAAAGIPAAPEIAPIVTKDGQERLVEWHNKTLKDAEGRVIGILATGQDISERKRADEHREASLRRLQGLTWLRQALLEPAPLQDKLRQITDAIVKLFDADFCRIWLIGPGDLCQQGCVHAQTKEGPHVCHDRGHCLHLAVSSGRYTHIDGQVHRRVPFGCYKIGPMASGEDHRFLTNDAQNDPRIHNNQWARDLGLVSFAGYQLRVPGAETLGVLALFARHPISPEEDALLDGLGSTAALVIQQATSDELLRESEERHRVLFDSSRDAIMVIGPPSFKFIHANPATLQMFGVATEAEFTSLGPWDVSPQRQPDGRPSADKAREMIETALHSGSHFFEWTHKRLSGGEFPATVLLARTEIAGQMAIQATVRDITDWKRAEQTIVQANERLKKANCELKEMQAQVIQGEKLASIGQLAAGVAHEMNTPIGFVASNFQTLQRYMTKLLDLLHLYEDLGGAVEDGLKEKRLQLVENIRQVRNHLKIDFLLGDIEGLFVESKEGLDRVAHIIQNLRDFSRIDQAEESAHYSLNEGIKATLVVAQNELKDDAEVQLELGDVPPIPCRAAQVNQVFLNVLVNAAQAIRSQERSGKGTITIRTYLSGDDAVCEIADDGPGIPAEILSKIFDPFFTTKPVGKGTGLGLSISYDIVVNKHHGQIGVASTVGQGTTFTVKLPMKQIQVQAEQVSVGD